MILFDELEKGSGPLFDLMLQITDKGVLQLNNGETVSFRDSVIIMTSNLGAREMAEAMSSSRLGFGIKSPVQDETLLEKTANSAFDDFFRPEFIGRINKKVVFKPLGVEEMQNIIDIKLSQANKEYRERFGAGITLSEGCRDFLISQALMKPHLGARPLIDQLDQRIHSEFGRHIAADNVSEGMEVRVFHENEVPDEYHNHVSKSLVFAVKPNIFMKKPVSAPSPLRVSDLKKYEQSYPLFISP